MLMILCRRLVWLVLLLAIPTIAKAQMLQPRIQSVFPAGGQLGRSVGIELGGTDLDGADQLWFDHPGLSAEPIDGNRFRVAIDGATPVGQHDIRAVGRFGISNPRTFVVGSLPESIESEPNDTPDQATTIEFNSVVNGRSNPSPDVDYFAFEGQPGQRMICELAGVSIESRMDGWMTLLDPDGKEIAVSRNETAVDSILDATLEVTGTYRLRVQDLTYSGSNDHGYRLTIHDRPRLDSILPSAITPGASTTLTLFGRNLGEAAEVSGLMGGQPVEQLEVLYQVPRLEEGSIGARAEYLAGPAASRHGVEYRLQTDRGETNSIFLGLANDPVLAECEPNDDPATAQEISVPCEVTGTFGQAGDLDRFRFEAKRGEVYWIEIMSERLGSPADPNLLLQELTDDRSLKDLASSDDLPDPRGFPVSTATVDAALRWQAPADGSYFITVSDLYGLQRGDVRFRYHLQVRFPRPDFELYATPIGTAAQPLGLSLRSGGRTLAYALVKRRDGFQGSVRVEATECPPGVIVAPAIIAPGQFQAPIVISAPPGTEQVLGTIKLVGREVSQEGAEVEKPGQPAIPISDVWAGNTDRNNPYTLARATRGLAVAVLSEAAPLSLSVTPQAVEVARGGSIELSVQIDRAMGFEAAVEAVATDLPQDVPEAKVSLEKDASAATLTLQVPDKVEPGVYTILLRGTAPYVFRRNPGDEKDTELNLVEPSNPITLTILD